MTETINHGNIIFTTLSTQPVPLKPAKLAVFTDFANYNAEIFRKGLKCSALVGAILIPAFAALDFMTVSQELWSRFLSYRAALTLALLLQYVILRNIGRVVNPLVIAYADSLIVSFFLSLMTRDAGGFASGYYVGVLLVMFASNTLLPWRTRHAALNGAGIIATYVFCNVTSIDSFTEERLFSNLSFLLGGAIISCASVQLRHKLMRAEFTNRQELAALNERLMVAQERLAAEASNDSLTGLWNRKILFERMREQADTCNRYGSDLTALLLDVDNFKLINDNLGHPAGDAVLAELGIILLQTSRVSDIPARLGGEEFVVILPNTDVEGALIKAQNLQKLIRQLIIHHGSQTIKVTVSIGVSAYQKGESVQTFYERLDDAMYYAKTHGKDLIHCADVTREHVEPAELQPVVSRTGRPRHELATTQFEPRLCR